MMARGNGFFLSFGHAELTWPRKFITAWRNIFVRWFLCRQLNTRMTLMFKVFDDSIQLNRLGQSSTRAYSVVFLAKILSVFCHLILIIDFICIIVLSQVCTQLLMILESNTRASIPFHVMIVMTAWSTGDFFSIEALDS